jgi:hypothetical protein
VILTVEIKLYRNFEPEVVLLFCFVSVKCECTQAVASVKLCLLGPPPPASYVTEFKIFEHANLASNIVRSYSTRVVVVSYCIQCS